MRAGIVFLSPMRSHVTGALTLDLWNLYGQVPVQQVRGTDLSALPGFVPAGDPDPMCRSLTPANAGDAQPAVCPDFLAFPDREAGRKSPSVALRLEREAGKAGRLTGLDPSKESGKRLAQPA